MNHPNELDQQLENLRTLQQSYNQLASDVQAIKNAHILEFSIGGLVFADAVHPNSAFDALLRAESLESVTDNEIVELVSPNYTMPNLKYIECRKAEYLGAHFFYTRANEAETIILPMLETYGRDAFALTTKIKLLDLTDSILSGIDSAFNKNYDLICLKFGRAKTTSFSVSGWNPVNGLLTNETNLITDEYDEFGNPITNNLEQLLYNIRQYIAGYLNPEITATITFSAAVYAAISADQDTMDAFPASWTIASA